MNTDQGSQFTGSAWITTLTEAGMRISMDGRGRCADNIFIERLCRSLKQEAVDLKDLTDGYKAHGVIRNCMKFFNTERPHSALEHKPRGRHIGLTETCNWRHENKPGYTLYLPLTCPDFRDHFTTKASRYAPPPENLSI
ncbi:MAG: integrase core domain-containing protein [Roseobacter sp.]